MNSAWLRRGDKKTEITAQDAALKSEKRGFCPKCGDTVNLHAKRKPSGQPTHFEHQRGSRKGKHCPLHDPSPIH